MSELPYFTVGEVPRAADFARLVAAVRELMPSGVCAIQRRRVAAGGRFYFPVGGRARVERSGGGEYKLTVSGMSWWQCGQRTVTSGSSVTLSMSELTAAQEAQEVLGVHGALSWNEEGSVYGRVRTVGGVSYSAAVRWRGVGDGAGGEWPAWHGECEGWGAREVTRRGKCLVWMQQWAQPEVCLGVWLQEPPRVEEGESEMLVHLTRSFGGVEVAREVQADGRVMSWACDLDARGFLHFSFNVRAY